MPASRRSRNPAADSGVPAVAIRLILCSEEAPNGKVGVLMDLAREARHPLLIVSDSDITVPPGYLKDVTAPLADPSHRTGDVPVSSGS